MWFGAEVYNENDWVGDIHMSEKSELQVVAIELGSDGSVAVRLTICDSVYTERYKDLKEALPSIMKT